MSRNKEKAQSNLNRYYAQKNQESGILESNPNLRPRKVQSVTSLAQAEKWRRVILSEISVNLTKIQDSTLSDFQIRELNDSINKLFKEKKAWEFHIRDTLKGNDYIRYGKDLINTGVLVDHEVKGYRYFGRAKELPDVKQLIESKNKKRTLKETKREIKQPDYEYYGYLDEQEPDLGLDIPYLEPQDTTDPLLIFENKRSEELFVENDKRRINFDEFPTNQDVTTWLVNKKRQELLDRLNLKK